MKLEEGALSLSREFEKELSDSISGEDPSGNDVGLDPPSGLVVWMCTHCLDLPSQKAPQELHAIKAHIRDRCAPFVLHSKVLCRDVIV